MSLGEMWESQAGGVGHYLLKLLVHLVLLVVNSQGNKGLPGLPFLTRMEQAVPSLCPSVGWSLIRCPPTVFLQVWVPSPPSSLPLTAAFSPPSRALLVGSCFISRVCID